jgi:hypothetical protein
MLEPLRVKPRQVNVVITILMFQLEVETFAGCVFHRAGVGVKSGGCSVDMNFEKLTLCC